MVRSVFGYVVRVADYDYSVLVKRVNIVAVHRDILSLAGQSVDGFGVRRYREVGEFAFVEVEFLNGVNGVFRVGIVGIDYPEFSVHNAQALRIPEFSEISFALFRNSADFRGFGRRIGRVDRKQTFARGVKQFIARFFALGERFHVFHAGDDFPRDGVDGGIFENRFGVVGVEESFFVIRKVYRGKPRYFVTVFIFRFLRKRERTVLRDGKVVINDGAVRRDGYHISVNGKTVTARKSCRYLRAVACRIEIGNVDVIDVRPLSEDEKVFIFRYRRNAYRGRTVYFYRAELFASRFSRAFVNHNRARMRNRDERIAVVLVAAYRVRVIEFVILKITRRQENVGGDRIAGSSRVARIVSFRKGFAYGENASVFQTRRNRRRER